MEMSNEADDVDIDDDPSDCQIGRNNRPNMLTGMITKLETTGALARVQEYGRHQQKGAKQKKKANKKKPGDPDQHDDSNDANWKKDEKYYDLDDSFIDDEDLHDNQGEEISEVLNAGNSNASQDSDELESESQEEEEDREEEEEDEDD